MRSSFRAAQGRVPGLGDLRPGCCEHRVEGRSELSVPVPDQEPGTVRVIVEIHQQVAGPSGRNALSAPLLTPPGIPPSGTARDHSRPAGPPMAPPLRLRPPPCPRGPTSVSLHRHRPPRWPRHPVLLRVYANCIDGQADAGNPRIDDARPATILVASNYRLPPGIAFEEGPARLGTGSASGCRLPSRVLG